MPNQEKQFELIFSLFDRSKEFYYLVKTCKDPGIIRYAQERLKREYKLADHEKYQLGTVRDAIVQAGAEVAKQQLKEEKKALPAYNKIYKTPDQLPNETIESILNLGKEPHEKVFELLQIGYLTINLGVHAPNVILFAGLMAQAYNAQRNDFACSIDIFQTVALDQARLQKKRFDQGLDMKLKQEKCEQILKLEKYLKRHFRTIHE